MNQTLQRQILNALLALYQEVVTCDGFNVNQEGPENDAEKSALKALQAAGILDESGNKIIGCNLQKISFDEFVATRKYVDDIEKEIGLAHTGPSTKGYVYMGIVYIEKMGDDAICLHLSRDVFHENECNLPELEKMLYDAHFGN
jgi:hypothetical protein